MKLKKYKFGTKTFVAIVNAADCPQDPYVSAYIGCLLASRSINTATRYANELIFVLKHFADKKIDLVGRVASGHFISNQEYVQWYDSCCLGVSSQYNTAELSFKNIEAKDFRNILSANQRVTSRVSGSTIRGRLRRLRDFINWLYEKFHEEGEVSSELGGRLKRLICRMRCDEEGIKDRGFFSKQTLDDTVIHDDIYEKMLSIIEPSSPENPFRKSKLRNYLIVSILAQSGIRRGALAKAKVSDFKFHGAYDSFLVYKSGNDVSDPRFDKPNQKTRAHIATIEPHLMRAIKHYVDTDRAAIPQSQAHDYLLLSESNSRGTMGNPISLKSINEIFSRLSEVLNFHIYPHLLRHKWNEIYDIKASSMGIEPERMEDARKYAMGWSQNSSMNRVYNEKRLAKLAREISECHQERVDRQ
ncbi:site-specific integrase [Pseudomonas coronafaciens]|uniref:Tyrosine-type recombinase/integrase n=1 Tax=Pseudomonas coronafaciens pv. coronafaciens TaxID=235275 RepID=A0AAE6ULX5_9PSED|nr:site-specific integrase [Pseudomonas coronafaciens]QGT82227.1 tyrosine-type recombinase/integrase [Pseudomonas coronafaciens pv. coronafaciens]RMM83484.1 Site-specific recombinase XerD [Pseudomonas coronafaciens pv. striafaciens]RMS12095.1 Site-specific recombinase XerD [Pseudomonas coronafaciens pv. coronafaciens]